jgi:mRNA-degrading endonuclease RelE of RelBE toxin-antitoxin system
MPGFQLQTHKSVRKDLKKVAPRAAREMVNEEFPKIADNPSLGVSLSGDLKGYFKYVFHSAGVSYRIVYLEDYPRLCLKIYKTSGNYLGLWRLSRELFSRVPPSPLLPS